MSNETSPPSAKASRAGPSPHSVGRTVIILAAGLGTRLRPLTEHVPKTLAQIGSRPLLFHNLRHIEPMVGAEVGRVIVVLGYFGETASRTITEAFPFVEVVRNHVYDQTNNMHSLYLGLASVSLEAPLVVFNGDCIYEGSILQAACRQDGSCIFVDSGTPVNDESMKVTLSAGRPVAISKAVEPASEQIVSIDLYAFAPNELPKFHAILDSYEARGDRNSWTEVALDQLMRMDDVEIGVHDVEGAAWIEIDNHDDAARARALFSDG